MILIPPSLLYFRVQRFRLWLPLFVLWPVLAALELVLEPAAVIAGLAVMPWNYEKGRLIIRAVPCAIEVFALTRGLTVDVQSEEGKRVVVKLL